MLKIDFHPFPELTSNRLNLRRLTEKDADAIFKLRSDAEIMKYIPRPIAKDRKDAIDHIEMIDKNIENNGGINWAIILKDTQQCIGIIGHYRIKPEDFRSEIGYMLLPEFHSKGYASEAIEVVTEFGFKKMHLHSIEAIIDPRNTASAKVLEKNGYLKEAHLKENTFWNNEFQDSVIYSKITSEH